MTINQTTNGKNFVLDWAVRNQKQIVEVSNRMNLTPQELIILMLDDALEAYSNMELAGCGTLELKTM